MKKINITKKKKKFVDEMWHLLKLIEAKELDYGNFRHNVKRKLDIFLESGKSTISLSSFNPEVDQAIAHYKAGRISCKGLGKQIVKITSGNEPIKKNEYKQVVDDVNYDNLADKIWQATAKHDKNEFTNKRYVQYVGSLFNKLV